MPDDSMSPDDGDISNKGDLPVEIGTLEVDGVRPAVGDTVSLKVGGSINKIVNQVAWVTPETVNDLPIPAERTDASEDELMKAAEAHDAASGIVMPGY